MNYRIILIILPLFLVGCQSVSRNQNDTGLLNWNYGDLRLLDTIDTSKPDQDLIAIYTRIVNQSFQMRLDFLDLNTYLGKDIYIPMDTNPGGNNQIKTNDGMITSDINWDYLIRITDSGDIEILDSHLVHLSNTELFIVYDSWQDSIVISCNKSAIPLYYGQTKLQVIITPINQKTVSDKSEPFLIDAPSPSRAKVLFTFWNTFSSITPAQTLRSWAGAHTGPMSSRHGLSYLIDSVGKTNSTVFLLDLLTPNNISALDYINALPRIRDMVNQGLVVLPRVDNNKVTSPGTLSSSKTINPLIHDFDFYKVWQINNNHKDMGENYNFYLFMNKFIMLDNKILNLVDNDYAHNTYNNNICNLLPSYEADIGSNNLFTDISVDCKRILISFAIAHPTTPLLLGGDFSKSILGDPASSTLVFSYIHSHPWIQILSIYDLMNSNNLLSSFSQPNQATLDMNPANLQQDDVTKNTDSTSTQYKVYEALLQSPKNQLTNLAWEVFNDLTQADTLKLTSLRANYIGQIGFILAAAKWKENPISEASCNTDLDYDGLPECIQSNDNIFAIIEPDGGYVPMIFSKDKHGIHQLIGPTWEFIVGLSDAYSWNLELGVRADPSQLLGAFQDTFDHWNTFNFKIINNEVELYNNESAVQKLFTIFPNSLHVDIHNPDQFQGTSIIPLVVDPWWRYTLGWGDLYTQSSIPFGFRWGITSGEMVEIRSTNPSNAYSFNDSRKALSLPEDPNFDYSPGHYLPYPMSVVEISATERYGVDIIINP